jgi:hypothetical protein
MRSASAAVQTPQKASVVQLYPVILERLDPSFFEQRFGVPEVKTTTTGPFKQSGSFLRYSMGSKC